ncbi:metallophosphoesterase [Bacillus dakarensis]|uniref:metallophosphoesterase n=1 Tax=Robertmurraya dakarensis TaxID=1926278 RepID=UPI000981636C|nr:metallophosphoesterase [Bacillus dakarensis]
MAEIKINRRTFFRWSTKVLIGILGTGVIASTYSVMTERFWYEVKEVPLKIKDLPLSFHGWKMVQFSDVHFGFHYDEEDLRKVIKIINGLNPDILLFTGDLVHTGSVTTGLTPSLLLELKDIRGGKWAVIGNHDIHTKGEIIKLYNQANFEVLENSHRQIVHNDQSLYIAGLEDAMYGIPDIEKALKRLEEHQCILLLAHEPDSAQWISTYPVNAQFSGHSHGGQVRLPFLGPIIKQRMARKYDSGLYFVGESEMPLYVNRGIGTSQLPIRFFCRPEITVFTLLSI